MRLKHFYVDAPLALGSLSVSPELAHRLTRVLRLAEGAEVALFNGQHGLWRARLADNKARKLEVLEHLQPQPANKPLTLILAVPKRDAWEAALRQATELGASEIVPLKTVFSQVGKINTEKAQHQIIEAAEQCERLTLPNILPLQRLEDWLDNLKTPTAWAFERGSGMGKAQGFGVVLVGPEGGFSAAEVQLLQSHPHIKPFTLPTPILRTDTAVVASLVAIL